MNCSMKVPLVLYDLGDRRAQGGQKAWRKCGQLSNCELSNHPHTDTTPGSNHKCFQSCASELLIPSCQCLRMVSHYTVWGMCSLGWCYHIVPIAVFLPALATVFLALRYFPLFACVEAPLPFLGQCLGLAYSALWYVGEGCSALCWWVHLMRWWRGESALCSSCSLGRVFCPDSLSASCTLILCLGHIESGCVLICAAG